MLIAPGLEKGAGPVAERIAERRWEIRWQCGFPAASGVVGKAGRVGNTAEPCPLWGAIATLTAGRRAAEANSLMGPVMRPAVWLEANSGALDGMRGVTPGWSGGARKRRLRKMHGRRCAVGL